MKKKYETPQAEVVKLNFNHALLVASENLVRGAKIIPDEYAKDGDNGL